MAGFLLLVLPAAAQEPPGPQTAPPPAVASAPRPAPAAPRATGDTVTVPAGTRLPVVLENGISTQSAKPGDSVYFQTAFPVTQDNRIIIPVGSYVRGEVIEAKRPGRVKGRGEIRLRLDTLILPNGYTINLNAAPTGADTGGKEKVDSEGKIEGGGNKGGDAATIARTTATGATIGAIVDRSAKGAGIGAGVGGIAGLAAVLLTRGPDVHLPRGSTLDIVLERSLTLDVDKLLFDTPGRMSHMPAPARRPRQQ
ncbi:MAG: TrbI/VirB10 family protein [Acidobacteriia bacterium]|nr:TrbI/VirB10 family protein [Terriglobia bacterium]